MRTILITLTAALLAAGCALPAETAGAPMVEPTTFETTKPGEQPARWTTVATLAGTGNKRSPVFRLGDGDKRLVYTAKDTSGFGVIGVNVYIVPKGKSLAKSGGFPEVMADTPGKDSTRLAQDAGDYYLDVTAANAKWTVKVQEMK